MSLPCPRPFSDCPPLTVVHLSACHLRVGAITPTSAKILVRIPPSFPSQPILNVAPTSPLDSLAASGLDPEDPQPDMPVDPAPSSPLATSRLMYRQARPVGAWQLGPELAPTEERDWVQTVLINGLEAGRKYECRLICHLDAMYPRPCFLATEG